MRKYRWMICLLALLFLFLSGCGKEEGEIVPEQPGEKQQEEETGQGEAPVLTEIPTGEQRMDYWLNHSEEERAAYQQQLYALLDQCTVRQLADGLQGELEAWSAQAEGVSFTQVELECSQDPLLMWSGGDKRQYRNVTAAVRLTYDPSTLQGQEKQVMEPLLEQAQQVIRQSPYGLKLISAELVFVDRDTGYPAYSAGQVSVGVPGEQDPSAPIPPEEQRLQTLAYEAVSSFCQQEFSGSRFESLPYANMTLDRFGVEEGSQVLECQVRIIESGGQDALAQKLEELAQQLADSWMEEEQALAALDLTTAKITFTLRDSPNGPLVYELPLGAA